MVTFIPLLSLIVRRLHDTGRSGKFVLFYIIPHLLPFLTPQVLLLHLAGESCIIIVSGIDSDKKTNKFGPSPKYKGDSINVSPGNNYVPPNWPINQFPQPNNISIPVNYNSNYNSNYICNYNSNSNYIYNSNYPIQQQNIIPPQSSPFPQQNPIPNEGIPFPQQDPIQNQEPSNIPQNFISAEPMNNPQPDNVPPQKNPDSQENPIQQSSESVSYQSLDNPYSKPNPMQP